MAANLARWKIKSKAGKRLMAHNLHETVGAKTVVRERERERERDTPTLLS